MLARCFVPPVAPEFRVARHDLPILYFAAMPAHLRGVLLDIDGTITTAAVLARRRTTRSSACRRPACSSSGDRPPAGWCDLIARFWPVDAVVGENGALYFRTTTSGVA